MLLAKQKIWHSQIRECESLQETVGSLKQQLADALELRNLRPISNHSQHCSVTKGYHDEPYLEKETATINNSNEKILLQQQVYFFFLVESTLSGAIIVWTG